MQAPFIDREVELSILEREWGKPGLRLVIIYGRRRVGKTRLVLEWLRRHRGIYYEAAELSYEQLSREFAESAGRQLGIYVPGDDVVGAIESIAGRGERLAVVLDEFQYLVEADPSLPSRLMRSIDTVLSGTQLVLVLSGSSVSFFEKKLLGYRAPLHGRRTAQIRLRPLRLLEAYGFWPGMNPVDALRSYSVVGGTPAYLAQTFGSKNLGDVLEKVLSPGSPLLEEALSLLRQELREPRSYAALLKAIAEGATKPGKAAQKAGIDPRSAHRYIEVLEELDIVERIRPLGYRRGQRIMIRDPYFQFYYGYIAKVKSLIELGTLPEIVAEARRVVESYAPRVFEQWLRDHIGELYSLEIVPTPPHEAGPWWHRSAEIDLVVRSPGDSTTFIEAKWSDIDLEEARRILSALEKKSSKTGLMGPRNYYVVVARRVRDLDKPFTALDEARIVADYSLIMETLRKKKERQSPMAPHGARARRASS